jgi:hypothetical protein
MILWVSLKQGNKHTDQSRCIVQQKVQKTMGFFNSTIEEGSLQNQHCTSVSWEIENYIRKSTVLPEHLAESSFLHCHHHHHYPA